MRVMGIDPGTRVVGYGIIDRDGSRMHSVAFGAIRVDLRAETPARYRQIFEVLTKKIEEYRPAEIAVERVFSGKNPRSAIKIGEGRGIALLAAGMLDLPVSEYEATVVKKAVVGTGRGTKKQVQELVRVLLGLSEPPRPFDAADALAIAICHDHRRSLAAGTAGSGVETRDDRPPAARALEEMIAEAKRRPRRKLVASPSARDSR